MHVTLGLFLVVLALVLFALAGLGIPNPPRFQFIAWGLFCWLLSITIRI
jgi:hypothetical protein